RAAGSIGRTAAKLDHDLAEAVAAADPGTQRSVARGTARRADPASRRLGSCRGAPPRTRPRGGPPRPPPPPAPPPPRGTGLAALRTVRSPAPADRCVTPPAMPLSAVWPAPAPEPLAAALETLCAAATSFGREASPALFAELRRAFGLPVDRCRGGH